MSVLIRQPSRRDESALVEAVLQDDVSTVLELLDENPHLAHWGSNGQSLPLLAALHGAADVAEVLMRNGVSLNIFAASALGRVEYVESLLALAPALALDYNVEGWTPLHLAAHFAHLPTAAALAARGADIDAVSRNNAAQTPLHTAVAVEAAPVVDLLLGLGADVDAPTAEGCTALHIAAHVGSTAIIERLLAYGADPNAVRRDSATPILVARLAGHWHVIRVLRGQRIWALAQP